MKNKKWISLAAAIVLAVTALPITAFAAKKDGAEEKLTKVTLNEVAHSIFYAPQYVAIEEGYFAEEGLDLTLVTGFGADKVLTALISGEADIGKILFDFLKKRKYNYKKRVASKRKSSLPATRFHFEK